MSLISSMISWVQKQLTVDFSDLNLDLTNEDIMRDLEYGREDYSQPLPKKKPEEKAKVEPPVVEPKVEPPPVVQPSPVVQPKVAPVPVGPAGRDSVRLALHNGDLGAKLADPTVRKDVMDWLDTVGDDPDPEVKKELISAIRGAPEADTELRQKVFGKAFSCTLVSKIDGSDAPVPPKVLNKIVDILEVLPKGHLPAKWDLQGANGTTKTSGSWDPDNGAAVFEYGADDAPNFDQAYDTAQPGDPLEGTKCFDVMVRHEIGHAVDTRNNGAALTSTSDGGGWKKHGSFDAVLTELGGLISGFAGELQAALGMPNPPADGLVKEKLAKAGASNLQDATKLKAALGTAFNGLPGINYPPSASSFKAKKDFVAAAIPMGHELIRIILQGAQVNPYFNLGGASIAYGGRVYLNAENADGWVSFELATWGKKVSMYQYRSPGEWFAEFYATVNNASASVREKGRAAYPNAYQWLDDHGMLVVK